MIIIIISPVGFRCL